jgi:2',3'-cyclic-nucleotide 2'-phosphodiesterase (5'-nucleotidase family)
MDQSRDVQQRIDRLVERTQSEVLSASRRLAAGITKETERIVPPFSQDIERVVDEVFDFAERVMKGQRKMVSDMVKAINEQSHRTSRTGQTAAARAVKKAAPRKTAASNRAPRKTAASNRAPAKKRSAVRA